MPLFVMSRFAGMKVSEVPQLLSLYHCKFHTYYVTALLVFKKNSVMMNLCLALLPKKHRLLSNVRKVNNDSCIVMSEKYIMTYAQ